MAISTNNLDGTITVAISDNFTGIGKALRELPKISPEEAEKAVFCLEKQFAKMNTQTHKKRD